MPNTINVTHEVSDQFLKDVMTNAVESGCLLYWAEVQLVMRDATLDINEFQVAEHDAIDDSDDDDDSDLWYVIDKTAILKGIDAVLNGTAGLKKLDVPWDIRSMIARAVSEDDADIDATGCDVIIQAVMFGEIIYG